MGGGGRVQSRLRQEVKIKLCDWSRALENCFYVMPAAWYKDRINGLKAGKLDLVPKQGCYIEIYIEI